MPHIDIIQPLTLYRRATALEGEAARLRAAGRRDMAARADTIARFYRDAGEALEDIERLSRGLELSAQQVQQERFEAYWAVPSPSRIAASAQQGSDPTPAWHSAILSWLHSLRRGGRDIQRSQPEAGPPQSPSASPRQSRWPRLRRAAAPYRAQQDLPYLSPESVYQGGTISDASIQRAGNLFSTVVAAFALLWFAGHLLIGALA